MAPPACSHAGHTIQGPDRPAPCPSAAAPPTYHGLGLGAAFSIVRGACILMLLDVHSGFSLLDEITFAFYNYCFLDLFFQDKPHIFLSTEPPLMPLLS